MVPTEGLPPWDNKGVLPPIIPGASDSGPHPSPYSVDMHTFVAHFGTSPERIKILDGFLRFRSQLYTLDVVHGFQWLDGSFVENVEWRKGRAPNDIDIVTYFYLPSNETEESFAGKAAWFYNNRWCKEHYGVDNYPFLLGKPMNLERVRYISYWHSMWSHNRDDIWKGFVQVELDPSVDASVRESLNINEESRHE